ncbi:MAG TPA: cobalamin-binding protein [Castellaniella sp.]|uniref:cobalamin-binding protein n=1 Tax=Castellaniella sp. TaxID=1955812 RepID=UPI002EE2C54D
MRVLVRTAWAWWAALCLASITPAAAASPRVITLAPSVTELVFAAGAGADVVGTDRNSNYPPAVQALPHVGDVMQLDDEAILALRPTLVIGWQPSPNTSALAERLKRLKVPLIYANPQSLEDIPTLIRSLGRRLGTERVANQEASHLEQQIRQLHAPRAKVQSVFIEVSADPLYTLGKDPLINDILRHCGGRNLYADSRIAAPQVSVESVLHLNPDVVIMSPEGHNTLQARRSWWARYGLPAAKDGHFYAIASDWLHRPGPRLVDAAVALCRDLESSREATTPRVPQ